MEKLQLKTEIPFLPCTFRRALQRMSVNFRKVIEISPGSALFLVGSCAAGNPRQESDIDFAVIVQDDAAVELGGTAVYLDTMLQGLDEFRFPDIQFVMMKRTTFMDMHNHLARGFHENSIYLGGDLSWI